MAAASRRRKEEVSGIGFPGKMRPLQLGFSSLAGAAGASALGSGAAGVAGTGSSAGGSNAGGGGAGGGTVRSGGGKPLFGSSSEGSPVPGVVGRSPGSSGAYGTISLRISGRRTAASFG